jgi:hypothetical protein
MKTKILILIAAVASASFLQASVTLQVRTQLGNSSGTATNSLFWGVLVDSTGNGFEVAPTGNISAFDFTSNGAFGLDNYFVGSATTAFSPPFGGAGVALNTNPISLSGDVGAGDSFGLFWTDGAGAYGFVTESGAVLPSDGSTVAFNTVFTSDPYTAGGTIGAVPEPSSFALLGGLFALGCVMLRRRA